MESTYVGTPLLQCKLQKSKFYFVGVTLLYTLTVPKTKHPESSRNFEICKNTIPNVHTFDLHMIHASA